MPVRPSVRIFMGPTLPVAAARGVGFGERVVEKKCHMASLAFTRTSPGPRRARIQVLGGPGVQGAARPHVTGSGEPPKGDLGVARQCR